MGQWGVEPREGDNFLDLQDSTMMPVINVLKKYSPKGRTLPNREVDIVDAAHLLCEMCKSEEYLRSFERDVLTHAASLLSALLERSDFGDWNQERREERRRVVEDLLKRIKNTIGVYDTFNSGDKNV